MRSFKNYALVALSFSGAAFAAGDAGHGSAADLIAPAVNVILLGGFLIWKLKGPLKSHFDTKATDISNTLERASLKSKEAQMMLENEQRKISNLSNEISTINEQAEKDVQVYEKNLAKETEEKTQKLKLDANSKIHADKKMMIDELNTELLNQVIAKTKNTIKSNKDYQSKVSTKLLKGL